MLKRNRFAEWPISCIGKVGLFQVQALCRLRSLNKPPANALRDQHSRTPNQLPPAPYTPLRTHSSACSCGRLRHLTMHSSRSHASITISSLQEPFQCNLLQSAAAPDAHTALILLSDIFGCGTNNTLNISQVRACMPAFLLEAAILYIWGT
jgi:hypothetical protein